MPRYKNLKEVLLKAETDKERFTVFSEKDGDIADCRIDSRVGIESKFFKVKLTAGGSSG